MEKKTYQFPRMLKYLNMFDSLSSMGGATFHYIRHTEVLEYVCLSVFHGWSGSLKLLRCNFFFSKILSRREILVENRLISQCVYLCM